MKCLLSLTLLLITHVNGLATSILEIVPALSSESYKSREAAQNQLFDLLDSIENPVKLDQEMSSLLKFYLSKQDPESRHRLKQSLQYSAFKLRNLKGQPLIGIIMSTRRFSINNQTLTAINIDKVQKNSAASSAGLTKLDKIVRIGKTDLTDPSIDPTSALRNELLGYAAGEKITIEFYRANTLKKVELTLGKLTNDIQAQIAKETQRQNPNIRPLPKVQFKGKKIQLLRHNGILLPFNVKASTKQRLLNKNEAFFQRWKTRKLQTFSAK